MQQRDSKNLYEAIELNEGAYFYKKGGLIITSQIIDDIFNKVTNNIKYKLFTVVKERKEKISTDVSALVSLLVFGYNVYPDFFNFTLEKYPAALQEYKIAYLLIVEIKEYVVIVKKNISNLASFINQLQVVEGNILTNALVNKDSHFHKLKLTNMNMNAEAIRNKMYESLDLKNTMPMFNSHQSIITNTKFSTNEEICTLNVSTSRISKFGSKKNIHYLLLWINAVIEKLDSKIQTDTFISRFAVPINWRNLVKKPVPASILINWIAFSDYLETLGDSSICIKRGDIYVKRPRLFEYFVKHSLESADIRNDDKYWGTGVLSKVEVRLTKLGISLHVNNPLSNFYVKSNDKEERIIDIINRYGLYTISFEDSSYIYQGKNIYQNSEFIKDLSAILSVFEPYKEMDNVLSEKGTKDKESTDFSSDCIFNVVEKNIFPDADFLVCDDMGNEWADHIAIKNSTISFIHSKSHGDPVLSASKFQEVIGQAVKNIGNLSPNKESIKKKCRSLNSFMKDSKIHKCRIGTIDKFEEAFLNLDINPNKTREVCLAIDFISKTMLKTAFDKLTSNQSFQQKNSVIQMVWLLNGFISTCKEADLHCRIFCRP